MKSKSKNINANAAGSVIAAAVVESKGANKGLVG